MIAVQQLLHSTSRSIPMRRMVHCFAPPKPAVNNSCPTCCRENVIDPDTFQKSWFLSTLYTRPFLCDSAVRSTAPSSCPISDRFQTSKSDEEMIIRMTLSSVFQIRCALRSKTDVPDPVANTITDYCPAWWREVTHNTEQKYHQHGVAALLLILGFVTSIYCASEDHQQNAEVY